MTVDKKNIRGVFIAGTDTDVGKTIISAALMYALKSNGVDAVYMKPVQTGCRRKAGKLVAPDLDLVCRLAGLSPSEEERRWMAPCCFSTACSPHLAAEIEEWQIRMPVIMKAFVSLKKWHGLMLVEGAGGILTPLSLKLTMLDLMKAMALPVLLVARPGLGTINHTLLSLREIRRAGLPVLGVVLNNAGNGEKGFIEKSNRETIERMGGTRVLAEFPFVGNLRRAACPQKTFQKTAVKIFAGLFQILQG